MQSIEPEPRAASAHVARSAALVAALFALDKLLGVVRERAVANAFGASAALDAYIAAFEVPEGLNIIVTGAALTTSLIPILTAAISRNDPDDLWRLVSAVVNWALGIVCAASLIAALWARPIVMTLAPGFDPPQVALTVQLMRLVLVQTLVFGLSTLVTGVLQAHRHFLLPAISPLFYTLGRIFGATVLAPRLGIFGLAWGGLAGAACHLLVQVPWLIHRRARWTPTLRHADLRPLAALLMPRMAGMGVTYVNFVLPTVFGSLLAPGAISAYEYGWKLMQLPETVLGTAMGIVVLPTLAALASRGELDELRRVFAWALRLLLALALPAALGLLLLGRSLIAILLRGGDFDAVAAARVYHALQFFALGLVGHAALEVVARLFYARRDMWTPLWAALAGLALNAGLGWLLLPALAHGSIALSNSLGAWLQVGILLAVAQVRLRGLEGRRLALSLGRTAAATAAMGVAVLAVRAALPGPSVLVGAAAELAAGAGVYLAAAWLLGSEEIRALVRSLSRIGRWSQTLLF